MAAALALPFAFIPLFGVTALLNNDQFKQNVFGKDSKPKDIQHTKLMALAGTAAPIAMLYARASRGVSVRFLPLTLLGAALKTVGIFGSAQAVLAPNPMMDVFLNGQTRTSWGAHNTKPEGLVRVTRHPLSFSVAAYSVGNLITRFSPTDMIFWTGVGAFSVFHAYLEDKANKPVLGEAFYNQTSFTPFQAIREDRQKIADVKAEIHEKAIAFTTLASPLFLL
ncbi:hypothetical protein SmJEL517_g00713 [Synchytrium microbalum]|uniref:Uncharacterized protein n=1 Tax=Synchytrium microbalum TaxID=1806994 RepID=A0A507CDH8_9FUNG|nr:uncharacterized protein SmJEL517_g00713 [Synchytrium microbalum]TPX37672.1 hypothetical protein SmJEL517_g00713 [Synchytrium microbalum]